MTLYLLPNLLHPDADPKFNFVPGLEEIVNQLDGFFVEHPKEARVYLKHFDFEKLKGKPMEILDKETTNFVTLLQPLLKGEKWGIISDAGLPCIADPGAKLVYGAKDKNIEVVAIPGPSSIFLALMLCGIESQTFSFQGYLPRDCKVQRLGMLQLFIETPYNNQKSLEKLLTHLQDDDLLSIACDLTLPTQKVITKKIKWWKEHHKEEDFYKRQAIFLIKTRSLNKF
ncbi:MAG: SAM-dependent methyltransferase [Chlamydiae bacterium]|jgi:16S rRNA (cytidine1402-2'-O)-methyltransferase|nr:SAM-dependent methyltransferase [Chlamydiota bacterium]